MKHHTTKASSISKTSLSEDSFSCLAGLLRYIEIQIGHMKFWVRPQGSCQGTAKRKDPTKEAKNGHEKPEAKGSDNGGLGQCLEPEMAFAAKGRPVVVEANPVGSTVPMK